jgi:hypothetical protein
MWVVEMVDYPLGELLQAKAARAASAGMVADARGPSRNYKVSR